MSDFTKYIKKKIKKHDFLEENLCSSLENFIEEAATNFNIDKIYITESFEKRESYICGTGKEKFLIPKKYKINENFSLFLENSDKIKREDVNQIINSAKYIISNYCDKETGSDCFEKNS